LGDIALARAAPRDWPAVRDCNVIGMRAGDRSGVTSNPAGAAGGAAVVAGEAVVGGAAVVAGEAVVGGAAVVGGVPVVDGAFEAGALATGSITAKAARSAPKAALRATEAETNHGPEDEPEDEPTRARYAGAQLRRKSR
jgi:hypothetical protein